MSNQNLLFYWGLLSVSCSDNHWNTDVTLLCGPCPFGRICWLFSELFWPFFTIICPPLGFWRSRASSALLGYCREFSDKCVEALQKGQEPGERGRCSVVQLIHLALRLAWPTNYLSKGHSQALRAFYSFWRSEGKRSSKNPSNSQLGTGLWGRASEPRSSVLLSLSFWWSDPDQGMPWKSGGI